MAYNIHHGEGMDGVLDLDRIARLILEVNPDLLALQEVDSVVTRTAGVDQASELGQMTGMEPVFGRFMPYKGGAYGMAVLTRLPVVESENVRLPDGDEPRSAVSVTVETPQGRHLRFTGIHFYRTLAERLAQAQSLEQQITGDGVAEVLAGDFNSTPGDSVMVYLGERWRVLSKGEDRFTFSSFAPEREIDFILVRPDSSFEWLRHWLLDEPVISDHRPLVADLLLRD
ncbi:MAG: endonuclease/exonuclease/phosphatase family protein [Rhodothermales bacterium]|nr:endonuclease/exonuclease/phosphatase family protein [Rhodothermales bacterium]